MKKVLLSVVVLVCIIGVLVGFTNKIYWVDTYKGKTLLVDENGDSQYYNATKLKRGDWVVGKGLTFRFSNKQEVVYTVAPLKK